MHGRFAAITWLRDVLERPWIPDAKLPRHEARLLGKLVQSTIDS